MGPLFWWLRIITVKSIPELLLDSAMLVRLIRSVLPLRVPFLAFDSPHIGRLGSLSVSVSRSLSPMIKMNSYHLSSSQDVWLWELPSCLLIFLVLFQCSCWGEKIEVFPVLLWVFPQGLTVMSLMLCYLFYLFICACMHAHVGGCVCCAHITIVPLEVIFNKTPISQL